MCRILMYCCFDALCVGCVYGEVVALFSIDCANRLTMEKRQSCVCVCVCLCLYVFSWIALTTVAG